MPLCHVPWIFFCKSICGFQQKPDQKFIRELNDANFDQYLIRSGKNVVVNFHAPWCKACVKFKPEFKKAALEANQFGLDVVFVMVNTDENPILKKNLGIDTFPRVLLFPSYESRPRRYCILYILCT